MYNEGNFRRCKVYVGNLTDDVKKEHLEEMFKPIGPINSVWLSFCPKGFAFLDFDDPDHAEEACTKFHDTEFMGQKLEVLICGKKRSEVNSEDNYSSEDSERSEDNSEVIHNLNIPQNATN